MAAFSSISQFLNHPSNRQKLKVAVDETNIFLIDPNKEDYYRRMGKKPNQETLNQFLPFDQYTPVVNHDDFRILQYKIRRNMSIGSVIPTGGEIPATAIGQLIKIEGGVVKLSVAHYYDEETQIRMIELGQSQHIPKDFIKMLYGSVNDLQFKIMKIANVLTAQMMYQGRITYVDPRTNTAVEIIQPDTYPELYPDPLTGGASWDQYSTANGIQDLIDLNNAFYRINGYYPEANMMSREDLNHLLRQESTARYATSAGLINDHPTSNLPSRVTRKVLKQLIEDTLELVPIREWDAQYELEIAPGQTVRTRYIPTGIVTLCCERAGERLFAPTIESARTNNGKPKPGIFLKTEEILKSSPPQERSYGVARMLPFFADSRRMGGRRIKAA